MGPIIDITNLFPYRIIILFAYSFAFFNIAHSILREKYNSLITLVAIFAARILTSVAFFNKEPFDAFGYPTFALLYFIIIFFLTDDKLTTKILCVVFSFLSQFLSSFVIGLYQSIIYQDKDAKTVFGVDNPNLYHLYVFLTEAVLIVAVSFLFAGTLKLFRAKRSTLQSKKIYAYITFLPFSHIGIIIFSLFFAPTDLSESPTYSIATTVTVYIMMSVILLFDCSFPFVINHFEKIEIKNLQNEKELMKNKLDYQQMIMLKEEKQNLRKLKHDYANIISTAKGFIEINKPEKALSLFQNIDNDLSGLSGFLICSNETVNTIIYTKQQQIKNSNIKMIVDIEENNGILIDDYDLCRVLCNIIDNALNASLLLEKPTVCKIGIAINEDEVVIKSENAFDNDKSKKQKVANPELHGNGVGIIKEIAAKYDGDYTARQADGTWYTETFLSNVKPANSVTPPRFWIEILNFIIFSNLKSNCTDRFMIGAVAFIILSVYKKLK